MLARRWARSSSCSSLSCSELSHLCFPLSLTWNLSSIKCVVAVLVQRVSYSTGRPAPRLATFFFLPTEFAFDAVRRLMLCLAPVSWQRWLLYQQVFLSLPALLYSFVSTPQLWEQHYVSCFFCYTDRFTGAVSLCFYSIETFESNHSTSITRLKHAHRHSTF